MNKGEPVAARKLIIFPGGGSPDNCHYSKVYRLICDEALNYGYEEVDMTLRWPGHFRGDDECEVGLTLKSSLDTALQNITALEKSNIKYDIIGRSFGVLVVSALRIAH